MTANENATALTDRVLTYWFGPSRARFDIAAEQKALWFSGGEAIDSDIRKKFATDISHALRGERDYLLANGARGSLALVILLDQFTRNVYRGSKEAFSGDKRAVAIALKAVDDGAAVREELRPVERMFMYTPLMHSEDVEVCKRCVDAMLMLRDEVKREGEKTGVAEALKFAEVIDNAVKIAEEHVDIVRKFGRFPHRNAALERTSTEEELLFLKDGPRYGQ